MMYEGGRPDEAARAADGEAVLLHGRRRRVRLVDVPVDERPPVIRRYLLFAWGAHPHMPVTWHSRLAEVAAVAAGYPVFRVERCERGRRPAPSLTE